LNGHSKAIVTNANAAAMLLISQELRKFQSNIQMGLQGVQHALRPLEVFQAYRSAMSGSHSLIQHTPEYRHGQRRLAGEVSKKIEALALPMIDAIQHLGSSDEIRQYRGQFQADILDYCRGEFGDIYRKLDASLKLACGARLRELAAREALPEPSSLASEHGER